MRRKRAFNRGRAVLIFLAGGIGYLLGGWHAATLRNELSPAEAVALRFPEDRDGAATLNAARGAPQSAMSGTGATNAMVLGDPRLPLLSPEPMVPRPAPQAAPPAATPTAAPEATAPQPSPDAPPLQPVAPATRRTSQADPAAALIDRRASRPGFVLNDAQIASIKERLHLTADQEAMWPAVEAALRNVAYASERAAHRRGAPASAAQLASADPDSVEVQGLKSAAIPLIMSFNPEQKNEVRSLAHVMGLDNLASQL